MEERVKFGTTPMDGEWPKVATRRQFHLGKCGGWFVRRLLHVQLRQGDNNQHAYQILIAKPPKSFKPQSPFPLD